MALELGERWSEKSCSFEGPPGAIAETGLQGRAPICVPRVRDLRTYSRYGGEEMEASGLHPVPM